MTHQTKITLSDLDADISIVGSSGVPLKITHTHMIDLAAHLEIARAAADLANMAFAFVSTGPVPPSMPADFTLTFNTTDGRMWNQQLQYVKNDDRLSMTFSNITGYWKEAEIPPLEKVRRDCIHQYAQHGVTQITATWQTT